MHLMTTKFSDVLLSLLDPHPLDHIAAAGPLKKQTENLKLGNLSVDPKSSGQ
jgi:hypothetical protein